MMDKTIVKVEAFASYDNLSNEKTVITEHNGHSIKIESTTSVNEYEIDRAEANISEVHLEHGRGCFSSSNSDFEMESKIIIKEEPVVSEADLPNFEYLDCTSHGTKLENDTIISKDIKMNTKMQSIKQEFVSDIFSQNDTKCFSVDPVMKIKKDNNCSDTNVETITTLEINFQSEVASFSDENATEDGDPENKEATLSESPRLTRDAVGHHFKPDNGNSVNKETSMRGNTCSLNCAPPSGRKHFDSVGMMHDENNVLCNCSIYRESISSPLVCHTRLTSHTCEQCFKHNSELKIDPLIHSSRKKSYECDTCGKAFTEGYKLKMHKLIHSGIKPYKCRHCDKCFTLKSHLDRHKLTHSGTKPYKCEQCDKYFTQKSALNLHILIHLGSKPYLCEHCGQCFTQKVTLYNHKLLHSDSRPFKCEHCDKCFKWKSALIQHKLVHSATKPYKCERCDKCFKYKYYLNEHILIHSGINSYKCEYCGKCYMRKRALNQHKVLHSISKSHTCEHCDKCFTSLSHLNRHILIHLGSKPYKCEQCDKCFTSTSHLNRHILIHSGSKP